MSEDQSGVAQSARPSDGETLLPCPFCGGRANIYVNEVDFVTKWSVGCGDCNCNMDVCEDTPADAAIEWNARTPVPSGQTIEPKAVMPINPPDHILEYLSTLRGHHTRSEHANSGRSQYEHMRQEILELSSSASSPGASACDCPKQCQGPKPGCEHYNVAIPSTECK